MQIRIKQLSKREWHSISLMIGGESSDTLRLMIKNLGDWTGQLYRLSDDNLEIDVDVRGFYASPIAGAEKESQVFCVAGGIGITPVLSLVNDYLEQPKKWEKMSVVWVFQDWSLLEGLIDLIRTSQEKGGGISWHFFATTNCPEDILIPDCIQVFNRRPCLETKIRQFEMEGDGLMHAFVCGPESLSNAVVAQTKKRTNWRVVAEHF